MLLRFLLINKNNTQNIQEKSGLKNYTSVPLAVENCFCLHCLCIYVALRFIHSFTKEKKKKMVRKTTPFSFLALLAVENSFCSSIIFMLYCR